MPVQEHRRGQATRRRPAVKVVVFQCPCGTAARQRWPRFEQAPQTGHLGRGAGLIDEQASRRDRDRVDEWRAASQGAPARRRAQFFFDADPMAIDRTATDRRCPTDRSPRPAAPCNVRECRCPVSSTLASKNSAAPSIRPDSAGLRLSDRARCARPRAPHINPTYGTRHADAEPCRRTTTVTTPPRLPQSTLMRKSSER